MLNVIVERVPVGIVVWQASGDMKVYRCPTCLRPVFTQYTGTADPVVVCLPTEHVLTWPAEAAADAE